MPLFHDPHHRHQSRWSSSREAHEHSTAGSSQDRPCEDSESVIYRAYAPGVPLDQMNVDLHPTKVWTNDRQEIIHRIKESSPWRREYMVSKPVGSCFWIQASSLYPLFLKRGGKVSKWICINSLKPQPNNESEPSLTRNSLGEENQRTDGHAPKHPEKMQEMEELGSPADIQRPRSALHSGDFREGIAHETSESPRIPFPQRFSDRSSSSAFPQLGTSPTTPWFGPSPFVDSSRNAKLLGDHSEPQTIFGNRVRAPSLGSFSSSYVLKVPTSPLVHQANNTDLDFSPRTGPAEANASEKSHRRRTLPPETFRQLQESSSPTTDFVDIHSPCPSRQQDGFYSYHCSPRRSLTSAYSLQLASNVNTPAYRARRPSFASDISPKPHAPMVGSYEESILRGRMSMNPSKPLDFTAQIGVLGKGKCKGHLKCPPHVTVPFPAFFYSYPTSGNGRSISDDSPSPYVGQIDLENSLPKDDTNTTRRRRRHASPSKSQENNISETNATQVPTADTQRRREKKNRRGESPKSPPGGCYRIPQQGQLQIIIKNPHKTAVKLFLVPYDLEDMEPGTKTFIRQRSYSAGPVLDMPLSARKNYGTDRPEASLNATEDPQDKPTLRYLIHLNVCCPARGRFYLHSSIRVVFANRVPDGKEKLRNEIQLPEPRYSPYKPSRESTISSSAGARLAIDKSSRRRSVGQGSAVPLLRPHATSPGETSSYWSPGQSLDVLSLGESPHFDTGIYNKLNKDDLGYGGYPYPSTRNGSENGESLLAKRLRGLDVQRRERFDNS